MLIHVLLSHCEILRGRRNMSLISRVNWVKLTSDDKQQIDSRLRAIISLRREELSKPFVYGHTKVVISVKVNFP